MMPAAFIGHGSPMNALELNRHTAAWREFGHSVLQSSGRPRAILAISAHWFINATAVTAKARPPPVTNAPSSRRLVPAWKMETPACNSGSTIGAPVSGVSGYPGEATTVVTAAPATRLAARPDGHLVLDRGDAGAERGGDAIEVLARAVVDRHVLALPREHVQRVRGVRRGHEGADLVGNLGGHGKYRHEN